MKKIRVNVKSYSGHRLCESPRSIEFDGKTLRIASILSVKRKLIKPSNEIVNEFVALCEDGKIYRIENLTDTNAWRMEIE